MMKYPWCISVVDNNIESSEVEYIVLFLSE